MNIISARKHKIWGLENLRIFGKLGKLDHVAPQVLYHIVVEVVPNSAHGSGNSAAGIINASGASIRFNITEQHLIHAYPYACTISTSFARTT